MHITPSSILGKKAYLLSYISIVLLSWIRWWISGTIKVDDVELSGILGGAVSLLFLLSIVTHFISFFKAYNNAEIVNLKHIIGINLLGFFMLPAISNDIFSVLNYGSFFQNSSSIYQLHSFENGIFSNLVSDLYKNTPCVYGYGTLWISKLSILKNAWLSIFLFKLICLGCSILASVLIFKLKFLSKKQLWILLLNPLWTIHGIGHCHTEIICISLIFISLYFYFQDNIILSALIFGLAFTVKFSIILILPIFFIISIQKLNIIQTIRKTIWYPIILLCIIGFELFLTGRTDSIAQPIKTIANLWPSGTFADVLLSVYNLIKGNIRSNYLSITSNDSIYFLSKIYVIFKLIFLIYIGVILFHFRKNIKNNLGAILFFSMIGVLLLYSHRFMSWYLLLTIPLFFIDINLRETFVPILILGLFSTLQDTAHFNHNTIYFIGILVIAIPLTLFSQIYLLFSFTPFFDKYINNLWSKEQN